MRAVPLILLALPMIGCAVSRAGTEPRPAREVTLDASIPVAAPESLAARQAGIEGCFEHARAIARRVQMLQRARAMPGTLVGLGASTVAVFGLMRRDRPLVWGSLAVGYAAFGLTRLDRALNPRLRAARQRAAAAEAMWIEVRRQMNRWESAARNWNAARGDPALASWHAEDARLVEAVDRCLRAEP
jgi:hypothetical protein